MKVVLLLCACIALTVLVSESSASPAVEARHISGGRQKPGTCYRPGFGRRRRSAEVEEIEDEEDMHVIEKRQVQAYGYPNVGSKGNNGWKPPAPGPGFGRPQCYRDYDCQGNRKCCNRVCQTPSFVG